MDDFIRRVLDTPPMTRDREIVLARRCRAGDRGARDDLVTAGLRSVALHALMLGARGEALRDAVQAGALGLISAVDRFDPDRGVRLATYAWHWVEGAVLKELARPDGPEPPSDGPHATSADSGIEHWLDGLDDVGRDVLRLRFGRDRSDVPLSRRQVADRLGLGESQVRRIEAEAMRHLRGRLAKIVTRASSPSATGSISYSSIGRAADC